MSLLFFCFSFINGQTLFQKGDFLFKQEKFIEARPIFENHLKQYPKDKQTLEYLGDIAGHSKDWNKAIFYYEVLVNEDPSNANYHYKYGGALGMKAMSVSRFRALSYIGIIKNELELAAQLDPKHVETRWALIEFYIQLPTIFGGNEIRAIQYASELCKISKVDGHLALGHITEHYGRFQEAERHYINAIEAGGSPHTYEKLIKLYEKDDQPEKAIHTASISLKLHQRNRLNYQIGKICAEYNLELEYGIQRLSDYLANFSDKEEVPKEWAFYRMAQLYRNRGEMEMALTWINKALLERSYFKEALEEKFLILSL